MRNKVKIVSRQDVTDEELERFKNFDSLLTTHYRVLNAKKPVTWRIIVLAVIVLASLVFYWLYTNNQESKVEEQIFLTDSVALPDKNESNNDTAVVTVEKSENAKTENLQTQKTKPLQLPVQDAQKPEQPVDSVAADNAEISKAVVEQTIPEPVTTPKAEPVYVKAEPVNGYDALYAYFSKELIYPAAAVKDSIEGVLTVKFLINKEGRPEKIQTSGTLGVLFDKEAERLIQNMPLWKPATVNGKPITSKLSIPLTFQLRNRK